MSAVTKAALLEKMNQLATKGGSGGAKQKRFVCKQGRNNLLILPYKDSGIPFDVLNAHKNLFADKDKKGFKVTALSNYLEAGQKNDCPIAQTIAQLKQDDWKANRPIWSPIEEKPDYYSWVIDLDNIDAGLQLWRYGKTVYEAFQKITEMLEDDEPLFFDLEEPQMAIISYDKEKDAALMYNTQVKAIKDKKILATIAESKEAWLEGCENLKVVYPNNYTIEQRQELIDNYLSEALAKAESAKSKIDGLADDDE